MRQRQDVQVWYSKPITIKVICDVCGKELVIPLESEDYEGYNDAVMERANWVSIHKSFSYGSIIGDEEYIEIDMCEQCFVNKLGMDLIQSRICPDPDRMNKEYY